MRIIKEMQCLTKQRKRAKEIKITAGRGVVVIRECAENRNERRPEGMRWAWGNRTGSVEMGRFMGRLRRHVYKGCGSDFSILTCFSLSSSSIPSFPLSSLSRTYECSSSQPKIRRR